MRAVLIALGALAATCALFIAAGIYLLYFHDFGPRDPPLSPLEQQVQQKLHEVLNQGATEIRLTQVASFPWDQACTVMPYTGRETLNKAAGKTLRGYSAIEWIDNDAYWTLAFIAGKDIEPARVPLMALGRYDSGGAFVECSPRASAVLTYRVQRVKELPPRDFYFARRQREQGTAHELR